MSQKKVVVIGCGAAGMMAAIAAAENGAAVTVLDSQKAPGRKLLMTGNSRCNLTNLDPRLKEEYQSGNEEKLRPLIDSVLGQFSVRNTLDLFHQMGLLTMVEHDTYVYPVTGQSVSVLDILLEELKERKVKLKYSEKVTSIERIEGGKATEVLKSAAVPGWIVTTESWHYEADSVIIACGGRSFPQTGSDGSGYQLAGSLGLRVTDTCPALTGISVRKAKQPVTYDSLKMEEAMLYGDPLERMDPDRAEEEPDLSKAGPNNGKNNKKAGRQQKGDAGLSSLAGIRMNAGVSAIIDGVPAARDIGQLQFTATDISGIVVFQVSRKVSRALRAGKHVEIRLDLIPSFTEDEVETLIRHYAESHPEAPLKMALEGLLPKQLIPHVLEAAGVADLVKGDFRASGMDRMFIRAVSETIKSFRLEAAGVRGFESCQVTAGGIDLSEADPERLQCIRPELSGLYFAGEVLDVDGPCGGYNLQWAWSSGYVAGSHAAKHAERKA